MAKRKVRRSVARKPVMPSCSVRRGHGLVAGLTAIFLALFVITVWPAAMTSVHSIHWGWWLGLTIVFGILCKVRYCPR